MESRMDSEKGRATRSASQPRRKPFVFVQPVGKDVGEARPLGLAATRQR